MSDHYFDHDEEDVLHDAFLMIVSDGNDYENIEDVLLGETIYDQRSINIWKEELSE